LDQKSVGIFRNAIQELGTIPNVRTISSQRVKWGTYSIVQATLDCLRTLFIEHPDVSHIKLLSGQDYPIKPVADFERMIVGRGEMSLMELHRLPWTEWIDRGGLDRLEYTYLHFAGRSFRVAKRRLPSNVTFYGGSQFWCMSREHALYVLAQASPWQHVFRNSLIPDEIFFHTVLMNSKLAKEILNESTTYSDWVGSSPSPLLLKLKDFTRLLASPAYFARKFDIDTDAYILDAFDRRWGMNFDKCAPREPGEFM
jgi:hypothetical protein